MIDLDAFPIPQGTNLIIDRDELMANKLGDHCRMVWLIDPETNERAAIIMLASDFTALMEFNGSLPAYRDRDPTIYVNRYKMNSVDE